MTDRQDTPYELGLRKARVGDRNVPMPIDVRAARRGDRTQVGWDSTSGMLPGHPA